MTDGSTIATDAIKQLQSMLSPYPISAPHEDPLFLAVTKQNFAGRSMPFTPSPCSTVSIYISFTSMMSATNTAGKRISLSTGRVPLSKAVPPGSSSSSSAANIAAAPAKEDKILAKKMAQLDAERESLASQFPLLFGKQKQPNSSVKQREERLSLTGNGSLSTNKTRSLSADSTTATVLFQDKENDSATKNAPVVSSGLTARQSDVGAGAKKANKKGNKKSSKPAAKHELAVTAVDNTEIDGEVVTTATSLAVVAAVDDDVEEDVLDISLHLGDGQLCNACCYDDFGSRSQLISCTGCAHSFHTMCVSAKRIPFSVSTAKEIANRDQFIAANFQDWKCQDCVAAPSTSDAGDDSAPMSISKKKRIKRKLAALRKANLAAPVEDLASATSSAVTSPVKADTEAEVAIKSILGASDSALLGIVSPVPTQSISNFVPFKALDGVDVDETGGEWSRVLIAEDSTVAIQSTVDDVLEYMLAQEAIDNSTFKRLSGEKFTFEELRRLSGVHDDGDDIASMTTINDGRVDTEADLDVDNLPALDEQDVMTALMNFASTADAKEGETVTVTPVSSVTGGTADNTDSVAIQHVDNDEAQSTPDNRIGAGIDDMDEFGTWQMVAGRDSDVHMKLPPASSQFIIEDNRGCVAAVVERHEAVSYPLSDMLDSAITSGMITADLIGHHVIDDDHIEFEIRVQVTWIDIAFSMTQVLVICLFNQCNQYAHMFSGFVVR
jgi:hypothetical protein